MGNRLSKIVTRTGDDGSTGLADGSRVGKADIRMEVIGTIDELNSFIGLFLDSLSANSDLHQVYRQIQNDLFDLGGELAMPGHTMIQESHCQRLEQALQQYNAQLQPLKDFILPGGSECLSRCHIVRTVARRAERRMVQMSESETVNDYARMYLNRLSDFAFVTARWLAHRDGEPEVLWSKSEVKPT